MRIKLSDHFSYGRLLRYALPSIVMMIFTSIYSVVDGLFVSNIVGSNALSSINIVMPLIIVVGAFGFMLGSGGSAQVAMTLGQGKKQRANEYFSMLIAVIAIIGVVLSVVCLIFLRPICSFLGASDILMDGCIKYGRILLIGSTTFMLQTTFQTFFVVAEKPHLGLALTVISGVSNMILDFLFVYLFKWGIEGAAWATVIGYFIGGVIPLIYFAAKNSSLLRLIKPKMYWRVLLNSCTNGSSEMMTNISMSITTYLYNIQMMKIAGEGGVAAITVIMYINFIFVAIFLGFSMGTAPIVGYNYGSGNHDEMKGLFRKSLIIIAATSLLMFASAEVTSGLLTSLFVGHTPGLQQMASFGMRVNSISFLICGFNIYASSFFTALCNGKISALISFLRSLLLQAIMIYLLPVFFGITGIWLAITAAELLTVIVSIVCFVKYRKKYGYA